MIFYAFILIFVTHVNLNKVGFYQVTFDRVIKLSHSYSDMHLKTYVTKTQTINMCDDRYFAYVNKMFLYFKNRQVKKKILMSLRGRIIKSQRKRQRKTASFHPNWTSFYQPPTVQQIAELIWEKWLARFSAGLIWCLGTAENGNILFSSWIHLWPPAMAAVRENDSIHNLELIESPAAS